MDNGTGDWRDERDSEGFPVANEDRDGEFFIDYFHGVKVTFQCRFVEGLGWCWQTVEPPE